MAEYLSTMHVFIFIINVCLFAIMEILGLSLAITVVHMSVNYNDWKYYSIGYKMLPYYKYCINGDQIYGDISHPNDNGILRYRWGNSKFDFIWFLKDDNIKVYEKANGFGVYLLEQSSSLFFNDPYLYYWHKKYITWLKNNIDITKLEIF